MRNYLAAAMLALPAVLVAQTEPDAARDRKARIQSEAESQRDRQAQVQADTEQLSRRVGAMLRVLEHYKLDQAAERKLLAEAAETLKGLSQVQMREVLDKLDTAMKAADADTVAKSVDEAYVGHREALRKLKGLLDNYDSVRDLDTAVARLEAMARDEVELSFRVGDILQDSLDSASLDPVRRKRGLRGEFPTTRARRECDEQNDQRRDLENALRQIDRLRPTMKPDQLDRLAGGLQIVRTGQVIEKLRDAANRLQPGGLADQRHRDWQMSIETVWQAAGQLQMAAHALRTPHDPVQSLREARLKLAGLIDQLDLEARAETDFFSKPAEPVDKVIARGFKNQAPEDPVLTRARTFADDQGRLAHAANGIRVTVAKHAPAAAEHLDRGALAVRSASLSLRQVAPLFARGYQEWAGSQFRTALTEIDKAIVLLEKQRSDPLTATQVALEKVDKLLQEQKQLHEQTERHDRSQNDEAARQQAPKQNDLAKDALDIAQTPLPITPKTQDLLREASAEMHGAAADLSKPETKPAMAKQENAIAKLEQAKKDLADKVQQIEQRRDEMAALEAAKEKLDKLVKEQTQVAHDAKDAAGMNPQSEPKAANAKDQAQPEAKDAAKSGEPAANKESAKEAGKETAKPEDSLKTLADELAKLTEKAPTAEELAKAQAKVTPPTKDVSKDLQQAAPDAAKLAQQAAEKMEAAQADLQKDKAKDAAPKAEQAAKDLNKADELVANQLDQKRAQEAFDQSKLQPNQFDPLQTAMEVAKAMESTKEAAKNSQQAMESPVAKDLQQRQERLAQQAQQMNQPKAAEPADSAAKKLQKGDLQDAVAQQQKAMEQLQKASESMKGDPAKADQMRQAAELAGEQQAIKDATQALAKSQDATQMAREALQQAMAQSPEALKGQLDEAMKQLDQAAKDLQQGQPKPANQAQNQANQKMDQAMKALSEAAALAQGEMPPTDPGEQPGQQPGQQQGEQQGQKRNQKQDKSEEKNEQRAEGDRKPDGAAKNAKAELLPGEADGNFLNLPPRQREMIKQALTDKLPPEYANLIQQYFVNISKGKPAAKPAGEPPRKP